MVASVGTTCWCYRAECYAYCCIYCLCIHHMEIIDCTAVLQRCTFGMTNKISVHSQPFTRQRVTTPLNNPLKSDTREITPSKPCIYDHCCDQLSTQPTHDLFNILNTTSHTTISAVQPTPQPSSPTPRSHPTSYNARIPTF